MSQDFDRYYDMDCISGDNKVKNGDPKLPLKSNGSPEAEYITDPEQISFLSAIHCHPDFIEPPEATAQVTTSGG